jgi:voltage-gated potassium channel
VFRDGKFPLHRVLGTVPGVRWLVAGIVGVSLGCALLARLLVPDDFSSFGNAAWWAVQTVTTVGYGDVTPRSATGRAIAAVLMIFAVAVISLISASISASFVARMQQKRGVADHQLFERIDQRLARIEAELAKLSGPGS